MDGTTIVVEPRAFQFFGKKWTEATVMGSGEAAAFARHLVGEGVEFHHDPPMSAHGPVHRFLLALAPTEVEAAFGKALSPGKADVSSDEPAEAGAPQALRELKD